MPKIMNGKTRDEFINAYMAENPTKNAMDAYKSWCELTNEQEDAAFKDALIRSMSVPASPRANAIGQKADNISFKFIEPGLVHYNDVGTVLVKKETLDQLSQSFVGKPIFNETHKEVTSRDFSAGRADGLITRVWYNQADGWFWADAMVWDADTKENCRNGYSVSCAYDVTQWSDSGGVHNNIPYAREVMGGEYTHMAVVSNPRYEGARIIYNTKGGSMNLKFWKKDKEKPEVLNSSEVQAETATVAIDGKEVPMPQLIELWNAAEKKKAEEAVLANAKISEDDEIEIGGKKVRVSELVNSYKAQMANEEEDKKAKEEEERKNAEEKERKDKEDEERKNAEEKDKKEKEDAERKNSEEAFRKLQNANANRPGKFEAPKIMTQAEKEAEGRKRYGPKE